MVCVCKHVCVCVRTKESEYQAAVLTVLLCGAETWTLEVNNVRYLAVFHYYCAVIILSI